MDNDKCSTTNFDGNLSGYVRNISGGSIEGALVRIYFHNTYEEDYSDKDGYFQVTNIPLCKCLKIGKCSKEDYKTEWVLLGIHENTVHDFILTYTEDFIDQELVYVSNLPEELYAHDIPDADDLSPPVTTHSLDPPEPDGENGWYVNDVNVTLNATDDMSGVKTIYYKIPGEDWKSHSGDSIKILLDHDCLTGLFKFYSVDNAGNQEEVQSVDIDIDQLPPYIQLWFEVIGGNPLEGWDIVATAYAIDNCSDMGRVEFYLNGGLQTVLFGPGPTYSWGFKYFGGLNISLGVYCCDIAGNCAYYEIPIKSNQNNIQSLMHPLFFRILERFPLLQRLLDFIK
jgi:hypothetical protein